MNLSALSLSYRAGAGKHTMYNAVFLDLSIFKVISFKFVIFRRQDTRGLLCVNIPWDCQCDWCTAIAYLTLLVAQKCLEIWADFLSRLNNLVQDKRLLCHKQSFLLLSMLILIPTSSDVFQWYTIIYHLKRVLTQKKLNRVNIFTNAFGQADC